MTVRRMELLLTCLMTVGIVASARSQEFTGVFTGEGLTLALSGTSPLSGTVAIEGERHAVTARVTGDALAGHYLYDGERVPFTATLKRNRLVIVSEGDTYTLVRSPAAGRAATAVAVAPPAAVEAPRGAAATGGPSLSDEGWGIRFTLPAGWKGARGPEGFTLGSDTHKGLIVVFPHDATSLSELSDGAREGFVDGSVKLTMTGTPVPFGTTGIGAEFAGTDDGVRARAYAVGLLSGIGSGAVALAVVEAASYDASYRRFVESLATSTTFQKPPVPEAVSSWQQDLRGKLLEYLAYYRSSGFSSGSGSTSQNERIVLCKDGSFSYRDSSRSSIDAGSTAIYSSGAGQGMGRWSVVGSGDAATLVLAFNGSTTTYRYPLQMRGGRLYLNGYKYYWSNARC